MPYGITMLLMSYELEVEFWKREAREGNEAGPTRHRSEEEREERIASSLTCFCRPAVECFLKGRPSPAAAAAFSCSAGLGHGDDCALPSTDKLHPLPSSSSPSSSPSSSAATLLRLITAKRIATLRSTRLDFNVAFFHFLDDLI